METPNAVITVTTTDDCELIVLELPHPLPRVGLTPDEWDELARIGNELAELIRGRTV